MQLSLAGVETLMLLLGILLAMDLQDALVLSMFWSPNSPFVEDLLLSKEHHEVVLLLLQVAELSLAKGHIAKGSLIVSVFFRILCFERHLIEGRNARPYGATELSSLVLFRNNATLARRSFLTH